MSDKTQAERLREPFPAGTVGKLPKVNCGACTAVGKSGPKPARDKHCDRHAVRECGVCGAYITTGHIHLDYVGHAAVTDRLLTVDPGWTWEPMATDQQGAPALDRDGNLWIRLTVAGVTRLGVGDGASMKERIGDAVRNAAMRFGVALDLWSKDELESGHAEARPDAPAATPEPTPPAIIQQLADTGEALKPATRGRMFALLTERGITERDDQIRGISAVIGRRIESRSDLTDAEGLAVCASLKGPAK